MNKNRVFQPGTPQWPVASAGGLPASGLPDGIERQNRIEFLLAAACVFFAPMNFLRLSSFYFTLSDGFAVLCLVAVLFNRSIPLRPIGSGTLMWNAGLLLMGTGLLVSSLIFGDPTRGFIVVGQYLFAYFFLPLVLLGRPYGQVVMLAKVFVWSIVLMCLHGVYVVQIVGETNTQFVSGSGRLLGFVERENECAALIALTVPLLLWLVGSGAMRRTWLLVLMPVLTYGVVLTGSNTGLLALVFAAGLFVLAMGSPKAILGAGASALLGFWVITTLGRDYLPDAFQRRVLGALESGDIDSAGTYAARVQLIREAVGFTEGTFLFGYGADQYREVSLLEAPVHNLYLLLWTEGGFVAMLGFATMLAGALVPAIWAARVPGGRVSAVCTIATLTLFAAMVNALPHVYGRFFLVPLLLAVAASVTTVSAWRGARTFRARTIAPGAAEHMPYLG